MVVEDDNGRDSERHDYHDIPEEFDRLLSTFAAPILDETCFGSPSESGVIEQWIRNDASQPNMSGSTPKGEFDGWFDRDPVSPSREDSIYSSVKADVHKNRSDVDSGPGIYNRLGGSDEPQRLAPLRLLFILSAALGVATALTTYILSVGPKKSPMKIAGSQSAGPPPLARTEIQVPRPEPSIENKERASDGQPVAPSSSVTPQGRFTAFQNANGLGRKNARNADPKRRFVPPERPVVQLDALISPTPEPAAATALTGLPPSFTTFPTPKLQILEPPRQSQRRGSLRRFLGRLTHRSFE